MISARDRFHLYWLFYDESWPYNPRMRLNLPGIAPLTGILFWFGLVASAAGDPDAIILPAPQTQGGKPLMQALNERQTIRDLKPGKLPLQTLANLLWAGFGINRPDSGRRTAPSAMNSQEVDLYVALPQGLYVYDPKARALKPVLGTDLRTKASSQPFATNAAAVLIYVADLPRLAKARPDQREFYAAIDTGCIVQNVYLSCASEGLATVVFATDRPALAAAMKLRPEQKVILAQAVGYPKNRPSPASR
jgi:nitroreductase